MCLGFFCGVRFFLVILVLVGVEWFQVVCVGCDVVVEDVLLIGCVGYFGVVVDIEGVCWIFFGECYFDFLVLQLWLVEVFVEQFGWDVVVLLVDFYVEIFCLVMDDVGFGQGQVWQVGQEEQEWMYVRILLQMGVILVWGLVFCR